MEQDFRKVARLNEYEDIVNVVSLEEAAERCNVSPESIQEMIELEYIAAKKTTDGWIMSAKSLKRLFPDADLTNLLN